ncbi:amidohydrolase [Synergistaceae bacterium OttesenSCG-928-I11]|nr:amidohydrolase [Synergistaceae bacterium OttesenSCG-928-I11]
MSVTFIGCKKIWTGSSQEGDAMLFSEEGIIAVGRREDVRAHPAYGASRKVELGESVVVPGLSDCHIHLLAYAKQKLFVDVSGARSKEELLGMLAARARDAAPDDWVCAFNLNEARWSVPVMPTARDLDALGVPNPILVQRTCTHATILNTAAMKRCGLDAVTSRKDVLLGDDGMPNGILVEEVQAVAHAKMSSESFTRERLLDSLARCLEETASYGLTTLYACGAATLGMEEQMDLYQELRERGALRARIFSYHDEPALPPMASVFGDRQIAYQGHKLFLDGSLGARTAALSEPYSDAPSETGMLLHETDELARTLTGLRERGTQALVHTIGDAALEQLLDAAELATENAKSRTWGIGVKYPPIIVNHCMIVRPDQIERMKKLGLAATVQPTFVFSDRVMAPQRLGDRIDKRWAYVWKSLIDAGIRLNGSSDCPIEPLNPWLAIRAAVTREAQDGVWMPEQRLPLDEALRMYTVNPAVNSGSDEWRGTIAKGKEADFAVLEEDIFTSREEGRVPARVTCTVLGGRVVYGELEE